MVHRSGCPHGRYGFTHPQPRGLHRSANLPTRTKPVRLPLQSKRSSKTGAPALGTCSASSTARAVFRPPGSTSSIRDVIDRVGTDLFTHFGPEEPPACRDLRGYPCW